MGKSGSGLLSTLIVSPSDLRRARRELETVDDFLHQAGLRQNAVRGDDGKTVKLPQTSRVVDALATESDANLLHPADRTRLIKYLADLIEHAPVLHISFASEPSAAFMSKLVIWLRDNIHPEVLVHLGLQPSIAAGCIVRTANKQFDFSLNRSFEEQRGLLVDSLKADPNAVSPEEARRIEAATLREAAEKQRLAETEKGRPT